MCACSWPVSKVAALGCCRILLGTVVLILPSSHCISLSFEIAHLSSSPPPLLTNTARPSCLPKHPLSPWQTYEYAVRPLRRAYNLTSDMWLQNLFLSRPSLPPALYFTSTLFFLLLFLSLLPSFKGESTHRKMPGSVGERVQCTGSPVPNHSVWRRARAVLRFDGAVPNWR